MPIYKYKTIEEADMSSWCFDPDPEYYQRVAQLWALGDALSPYRYPSGLKKFRSIEEANRDRSACESNPGTFEK